MVGIGFLSKMCSGESSKAVKDEKVNSIVKSTASLTTTPVKKPPNRPNSLFDDQQHQPIASKKQPQIKHNFASPKCLGKFVQRQFSLRQPQPLLLSSSRPSSSEMSYTRLRFNHNHGESIEISAPVQRFSRSNHLYWSDTVRSPVRKQFTSKQIKYQESIHELVSGEREAVCNFSSLRHYRKILNEHLSHVDTHTIFQNIDQLINLHEDLLSRLSNESNKNGGVYTNVEAIVSEWVDGLVAYQQYCPGLIAAVAILDQRIRSCPRLIPILEHNRDLMPSKLDLHSLLDSPRAKVVKYSLIFSNILKNSPSTTIDPNSTIALQNAIDRVNAIMRNVDSMTGDARLRLIKARLAASGLENQSPLISSARQLICEGIVRNSRGQKLRALLFDNCFALAFEKCLSNGVEILKQYRSPISVNEMVVDNVTEETCLRQSFLKDFFQLPAATSTCWIRVRDERDVTKSVHLLQCSDEHSKKMWLIHLQNYAIKYTTSL